MSAARVAGGSDRGTQWQVTSSDKLAQRRKADATKHHDVVEAARHGEGEVRDGPAEHVGQDDHAISAVHTRYRVAETLAVPFVRLVRIDHQRLELRQGLPKQMLDRSNELERQPPF